MTNTALIDTSVSHQPVSPGDTGFVWGSAPAIQELNSVISELARTRIPLLLAGESGTGKERYAREIHHLAGGSQAGLPRVSCSRMEATRLALELQECSSHGIGSLGVCTLLLDEVEDLDLECQKVLLSFIPEGEVRTADGSFCARLVSTTSKDLATEAAAGRFRPELYFRLNGANLHLPPLRERAGDIPAFVSYFMQKYSGEMGKKIPLLNQETMELLMAYHWPGNVRELENQVRRMVALGDSELAVCDLRSARTRPLSVPRSAPSLKAAARAASRQAERELILQALQKTKWNRKRAAQELRISYKSFLYKLKQIETLGADVPERG